jgi:hypothetical protein
MILITRCFEVVTPESGECGETAESGFVAQDEPYGFRELVEALEGGEPSSWPCRGSTRDWVTQDEGETREFFETGTRRSESIHFSRKNKPHAARYWRMALIAAGHMKTSTDVEVTQ